jgi:hypothetical protein
MKMDGEERANLSSQVLKMSLDYQFVTPLTSMTIRGMADQDGLEPTIDKSPEGMGSRSFRGVGCGSKTLWALIYFLFPPFQILSPWVSFKSLWF